MLSHDRVGIEQQYITAGTLMNGTVIGFGKTNIVIATDEVDVRETFGKVSH